MGVGSVRVLLVAGTGQNGATVFSRIIGGIPGFCAIGEIGHLWDKALIDGRACGCGSSVRDCPFWSSVGDRAFGGWAGFDAEAATALRNSLVLKDLPFPQPFALPLITYPSLSSSFRRKLDAYRHLMTRLYLAISDVAGGAVIVDSMKVPVHVFAMSLDPTIDTRVVHLVRDPRGVAYSNLKVVKRQGSDYRVRRRPSKTGLRWTWINSSFGFLARRGVPTEVLRYESFVQDPWVECRRVARFAGIDIQDSHVAIGPSGELRFREDHLIAGNRMRSATGEIRFQVDDEWRRKLSRGQLRGVTATAWPLMRRFGYPLDASTSR